MPALVEGDQKIAILNPIFNHDCNEVCFTISGAYIVNWGDGTIENFNSGIKATHLYSYTSIDDSTLCSRGYKQVIIIITPQPGNNLTSINFASNDLTVYKKGTHCFLDIQIVGSYISSITTSNTDYGVFGLHELEVFNLIGSNLLSSVSNLFSQCINLRSVNIKTTNVTIFYNMFNQCTSLYTIPSLDTSLGTNFSSMFYMCYSLQIIPTLNTALATNITNIIYYCFRLSSFNLSTIKYSLFLEQLPLSRTSLVTIFNSLATVSGQTLSLYNCYGYSNLTSDDKLIATAKGWTLSITSID